ncbi:MAG: isopentenyl phosphate kinase [Candidatus Shapirobacteria bacterium]|nr:isopentenyl phosphate kinase [Candidatus Shapirobacteria bacterium]
MERLILIKLGGSLITDKTKPLTAKVGIIKRLGKEIKEAKIMIGHGSGSFGHIVAAKYKTQDGIFNKKGVNGLTLVADVAIQINRIVIQNFLKVGLPVFSLAPASFLTAENKNLKKSFIKPFYHLLKIGLIPVIYGDVILDQKRGCCIFSAEKTLNILARNFQREFKILRIIHCGNTDGVYNVNGQTIPVITKKSFQKFQKAIGKSSAIDVTGGMMHKVKESLEISPLGIHSFIINGGKPGNLKKAILGEGVKGTLIK